MKKKLSVWGSAIFGYSHFNRWQIKDVMDSKERNVDVSYSFKASFILRRRKWIISQVINLCKSSSQGKMERRLTERFGKSQVFLWIIKLSSFHQRDCIIYKTSPITDAAHSGHIRLDQIFWLYMEVSLGLHDSLQSDLGAAEGHGADHHLAQPAWTYERQVLLD